MRYMNVDTESIGLEPIDGVLWSVAWQLQGKKPQLVENCNGLKILPQELCDLLEDNEVCKIFHNALHDVPYIIMNAKSPRGKAITVRNIADTAINEQVIQGLQVSSKGKAEDDPLLVAHSSSLKHTLKRYGLKTLNKDLRNNFIDRPKGLPFTKEEKQYMIDDVTDLYKLYKMQEYLLKRDGMYELSLLEMSFLERYMIPNRLYGVGFDSNVWRKIAYATEREYKRRMSKLPKSVSNWGSEKQVKEYFKSIGILITSYKEIDDVIAATRNKTLIDFKNARELNKAVTSYGLNWFTDGYISKDGRVRPSIRQIIRTGRNSISNPPLHNLPKKGMHRSAIVPRKGHKFVIGDFSGQEIGIMAAMSDEKVWIDALLRGEDIHSLTASLLYTNIWEDSAEKGCSFPAKCSCETHLQLREHAKMLNFMLAYGGGPKRFAMNTGLSFIEAKITVKRYKKIIPKLTAKLEKNGRDALNTGETYSASPYRRRRVLISDEEWKVVNQGKNSPIQMAGADMMKLAAISLPKDYYIPLIVHDEIVLEVPAVKAEKAKKVLKQIMEQAADYVTGIKGLIKVTPRIANNFLKEGNKDSVPEELLEEMYDAA
jgi:DNA polymerase I-like protein with 3'-5' exonuclease and polymerase domains